MKTELEQSKFFIIKCAQIVRGLDPDYKFGSDGYRNVEAYIQSFSKENPDLIHFLENNTETLSDISELHPQRINQIILWYKRWI